MYDYPSGDLHIGHWFVKTPTDVIARYHRMNGQNVFFPVGFDAFGLPAENAAIKSGVQPREWTLKNIANMRRQLQTMGAMWDWDAEVITCEPDYYRWNQWLFLRFLEQGLAYRAMAPVDWCPNDGVLAREQVIGPDRLCWRDGAPVVKRDLEQWFFRITNYADELLTYDVIVVARADQGPADQLDRSVGRARRSFSRPRRWNTTRAATRSACSRRGRTRCSVPRSWSWRRSIRWSRR